MARGDFMKIGIYKDDELKVYDYTNSILMIYLDDDEKNMIANMSEEDNTFLTTEIETSTAKLSEVIKSFKELVNN